MTFKEALLKREEDPSLEHQLRAAKVVSWFRDYILNEQGEELKDSDAQRLFEILIDFFEYTSDPGDEVVFEFYENIKDGRE